MYTYLYIYILYKERERDIQTYDTTSCYIIVRYAMRYYHDHIEPEDELPLLRQRLRAHGQAQLPEALPIITIQYAIIYYDVLYYDII